MYRSAILCCGHSLTYFRRISLISSHSDFCSPPTPDLHTKEKEASHNVRETAKTLYGLYDCVDSGQTSSDNTGMLWVIVKHVQRQHVESFYRTSPGKPVIVLKQPNLKEHYNHEINLKRKSWRP